MCHAQIHQNSISFVFPWFHLGSYFVGKYESWLSLFTKITLTQAEILTQVSKMTLAFISAIPHLLTFQLTFNRILVCIFKKIYLIALEKHFAVVLRAPTMWCSCSYLRDNCSLTLLQGTNSDFERICPHGYPDERELDHRSGKELNRPYYRYYASNVGYCWRSKYCSTLNGEMNMHGTLPILCKKYCILWVI